MQYLRISSVSQSNSVDMFTLGVSTSTGKAEKIGQFGSGSLMGVLLWLRSYGDSPIFTVNGTRVEFESKPERKSDGEAFHRVYQIESKPGKRKTKTPLSVSLEYGQVDWNESRMALREWISNALDNGADLRTCLEIVDGIDAPDDQVCVFVPLNGECRKYWQNIDQHFLHFLGKEKLSVIEKNAVSPCRVYRKGVLIRELTQNSLFDYNLDFAIDESRNGSSDSMVGKIMANVVNDWSSVDCGPEYYSQIVEAVRLNKDCIEVREQSWRTEIGKKYLPALTKLAENGIRFVNENLEEDGVERIQTTWYNRFIKLVPMLDGLKKKSMAELEGHIIVETPEFTQKNFDKFVSLFAELGIHNGKEKPELRVFKTKNGLQPEGLGHCHNGVLSIWLDQAASQQTMIEELAHHYSGQADRTRAFQEYLLRTITEMAAYFRD